ncbi:MAG TPA: hypothetical protein PK093_05595 [Phycisphaerae bacterium]|nr:hypothetical protein [Phycisphaerae bacterium]
MTCDREHDDSTDSDVATDMTPAWESFTAEILCPCCGYNLRELTVNRCPECGGHFEWGEEIQKAKLRESLLFEFQFSLSPIKSYLRSSAWLLRPWYFWGRVPVLLATRVVPLLIQLVVTLVMCGAALIGLQLVERWLYILRFGRARAGLGITLAYYVEYYFWLALPVLMFVMLVWLAIQLFWQTRRSYRIRQRQLFRVLLYPLMALLLTGVASECVIQVAILVADRLRWYAPWLRTTRIPSCIGFTWFVLVFARGLRIQLGIKQCWRMAAVVLLLVFVVIEFVVIQSGLYFGTLESFGNPVVGLVSPFLPSFWLL